MLRDDGDYRDLGGNYFDAVDKAKSARRLVDRLRNLGLTLADPTGDSWRRVVSLRESRS